MTLTRAMVLVLAVTGCGATTTNRVDELDADLRVFHEGLRWRRYDDAAEHVPPLVRARFLDAHEDLDGDLRIDDYEVVRVTWTGAGKDHARVRVRYTWHLDSVGRVHETTVDQSWERQVKIWRIVASAHHKGEVMPAHAVSVEDPSPGAAVLP
jgi:hypothetical protein